MLSITRRAGTIRCKAPFRFGVEGRDTQHVLRVANDRNPISIVLTTHINVFGLVSCPPKLDEKFSESIGALMPAHRPEIPGMEDLLADMRLEGHQHRSVVGSVEKVTQE